jgi:hypothetical protein
MGALCFSIQNGYKACPTIYVPRDDGKVGRVFEYPRNTLMNGIFTGTGCMLIHRSVFEKMRDAKREDGRVMFPKPYEWFHNTQLGDLPVGEDITFCIRAAALNIPIHVHTGIKCGHEKPFIVDEEMYDSQRAAGIRDNELALPTYVVMAGRNRHEMTANLITQLQQQVPNGIVLFAPPHVERRVEARGANRAYRRRETLERARHQQRRLYPARLPATARGWTTGPSRPLDCVPELA